MAVTKNFVSGNPVTVLLGIDPGASGGLAAFVGSGPQSVISMPSTEKDIWDWIRIWGDEPCFAYIEKVSGYVGEAQPGSAAFKFGHSYGGLRMALIAAGIPFEEVTPQAWQKKLGIQPRKKGSKRLVDPLNYTIGESKHEFKVRLKVKAQQLFPKIKVTLSTADAILIAEYCRRQQQVKLF